MLASRDRAGSHSPRVHVIGLDGASWNVLRPMMSKGGLPNISSLVGEGAAGDLESCLPYATLPAWTCYSTGMNPGRLGVYGWFSIDFESRKIVLSNTSSTLPESKDKGYTYPPEMETTLRERFHYRVYPGTSLATNKLEGLKEILELIGKRFDVAKTYIHQTAGCQNCWTRKQRYY